MAERIRLTEAAQMEIDEINLISHSYQQTLEKLREWKLLKKEEEFVCDIEMCGAYNEPMSWQQDNSRNDLGRFICYSCQTKRSVRLNSLFYNYKLNIIQLFRIIFKSFIKREGISFIAQEQKIDRHTVSRIFKKIRSEISFYIQQLYNENPIGTAAIVEYDKTDPLRPIRYNSPAVEVDETLVTHLLNIDGVYASQCWVIGGVDRQSGDFRFKAIGTERTEQIFHEFFRKNIATNPRYKSLKTRVYTDGHRSYSKISTLGYDHKVVVHDSGFGRGINTTNHIESIWALMKGYNFFNRGQNYTSIEEVQMSIDEIAWRIYCSRQNINLCNDLARILRINNQA